MPPLFFVTTEAKSVFHMGHSLMRETNGHTETILETRKQVLRMQISETAFSEFALGPTASPISPTLS